MAFLTAEDSHKYKSSQQLYSLYCQTGAHLSPQPWPAIAAQMCCDMQVLQQTSAGSCYFKHGSMVHQAFLMVTSLRSEKLTYVRSSIITLHPQTSLPHACEVGANPPSAGPVGH